jgi:hypothetical protein
MTNENRNWLIMVSALLVLLVLGGFGLRKTLEPPLVIYKEAVVTTTLPTDTTIVQVNVWCDFLRRWELQGPVSAAEEWVNTQNPPGQLVDATVEFSACSEFGKETARMIFPLWMGE